MNRLALLFVLGSSTAAMAEPVVTVSPTSVHLGDPVVITVTGVTAPPHGKFGGQALAFFQAKTGYQAVAAVAMKIDEDHILVEADGAKPVTIPILAKTFPETKLVVEEEMANPGKEDGEHIDAADRAVEKVYGAAADEPQFTRAFKRPPGTMTSGFGEWRTFNDGHRAQHLGVDLAAAEGSKV
ncbi:MAG: hypothetical protein ABI678_13545, partial [Kofleriaceae bacterium]